MAITNLNTLKNWFKTGLKPTQAQFWDSWDSFRHKLEKVPAADIEGMDQLLFSKADKSVLNEHIASANAHKEVFLTKENKNEKGMSGGYVPLNLLGKIDDRYINLADLTVSESGINHIDYCDSSAVNARAVLNNLYDLGFRQTGNLFDKNAPGIITGHYLDLEGNLQTNENTIISDFIRVRENTIYVESIAWNRCFYDVEQEFIGSGSVGAAFETPENAYFVRLVINKIYAPNFMFVEGDTIPNNYLPFKKNTNIEDAQKINHCTIIAERNAANYNSIRELANKLEPQSNYYNRYTIQIDNGEWIETDWQGWGDFITIKGNNRNQAIIKFDGESTYILPQDYGYPSESGKVAGDVSRMLKHIVFAKKNIYCENLTFDAESCKYPLHIDNPNFTKVSFKNCIIKERNCNYAIGVGGWSGQSIHFENCKIIRSHWHLKMLGVFFHNSNAQTKPCAIAFLNCDFSQCGYALLWELGSNQDDHISFINCTSDGIGEICFGVAQDSDGKTFWTNHVTGVKEADPKNVPYNLILSASGTNVDLISDDKSFPNTGFDGFEVRPKKSDVIFSDYYKKAYVPANNPAIEKGDFVALWGDANNSNALRIRKYISNVNMLPPVGVAVENVSGAGTYINIVPIGKYVEAKVSGTILTELNRKLKFENKLQCLTASPFEDNRLIDGYAISGKSDANTALLLVKTM